jgi:glycosyltransferase involved in cell wall biosynthesis
MNETPRYPRVLVVGQPFERASGGGITLSNLFEGWPKDRLAAVSVPGGPIAFDVCDRYYRLGTSEIRWLWPLSLVTRTETVPSTADLTAESASLPPGPVGPQEPRMAKRIFRSAVDGLGVGDALRTMHLSPALRDWIAAFQPDLVYSQLSDLPVMTLVSEVLDETQLPFALHIMDDWPSSMYRDGLFARLVRRRAEHALDSLLRRSQIRMAIGDTMAEEYLRRYGLAFVPIQNPVDLARQDALCELHRREYEQPPGSPVSVVYAGRVGRANAGSLLDVAEAVAAITASGAAIRLRVYTGSTGHPAVARMRDLQGVEVLPAVPYDHVPGVLASADVLLMPLDFDDVSVRFARLSMPTKIPEYMAAARPVLTYAPRGCAAAEYSRTGGWSWLVDERDPSQLRAALTALADDPALREKMGARARHQVAARHDAAAVRTRFAAQLARAGAGPHAAGGAGGL